MTWQPMKNHCPGSIVTDYGEVKLPPGWVWDKKALDDGWRRLTAYMRHRYINGLPDEDDETIIKNVFPGL